VGRALGPEPRDDFITGNGLYPAALQIVIAPVERFPRLRKIAEVFLDDTPHKICGSASALHGEVLELLFGLGGEVYFHALKIRQNWPSGNAVEIGECSVCPEVVVSRVYGSGTRGDVVSRSHTSALQTIVMSAR
jgi:hypothetical protein